MQIKKIIIFIFLTSILISCVPQAVVTERTPTPFTSTASVILLTITSTPTPLPSETPLPTDIPSATPASCAVPLNPVENASVPATGPFDFTWTPFDGAASYVVSIGPSDWYPSTFPITGTTLTRYMETFPSSPSYQWSIAALNSVGQEICKTDPYTFVTSADVYATAPFSGGQVTNNQQNGTTGEESSGNDLTMPYIGIGIEEYPCRMIIAVVVKNDLPITESLLIYGKDPGQLDESRSLSYSEWFPPLFFRTEQTIEGNFTRGETIYFKASFIDESGRYTETATVSHTMTCGQ